MLEENTEVEEVEEACYVAPNAPSFSIRVVLGEENEQRIKFNNKEYRTSDELMIAALDKLIETKPNIASIIHKVDQAAAEAMAREHMEQMVLHRGTVKGPVSGADAKRSVNMAIEEREKYLAAQGASIEDLQKMQEEMSASNLELTENAEGVVAPETRDGFVADQVPEPVPEQTSPEAAAATPGAVFANLVAKAD